MERAGEKEEEEAGSCDPASAHHALAFKGIAELWANSSAKARWSKLTMNTIRLSFTIPYKSAVIKFEATSRQDLRLHGLNLLLGRVTKESVCGLLQTSLLY